MDQLVSCPGANSFLNCSICLHNISGNESMPSFDLLPTKPFSEFIKMEFILVDQIIRIGYKTCVWIIFKSTIEIFLYFYIFYRNLLIMQHFEWISKHFCIWALLRSVHQLYKISIQNVQQAFPMTWWSVGLKSLRLIMMTHFK